MSKDKPSNAPLILQRTHLTSVNRQTLAVVGLAALVYDYENNIEYAILANSQADLTRVTDRLKTKTETVNEKKTYRCALIQAKDSTMTTPVIKWVDLDPQAAQPAPAPTDEDDDLL